MLSTLEMSTNESFTETSLLQSQGRRRRMRTRARETGNRPWRAPKMSGRSVAYAWFVDNHLFPTSRPSFTHRCHVHFHIGNTFHLERLMPGSLNLVFNSWSYDLFCSNLLSRPTLIMQNKLACIIINFNNGYRAWPQEKINWEQQVRVSNLKICSFRTTRTFKMSINAVNTE